MDLRSRVWMGPLLAGGVLAVMVGAATVRAQGGSASAKGSASGATKPALHLEPAGSADDFVERIGVCTHWGYADTPYGKSYDAVKKLLAESGIRHVRDGFDPHETDLFADNGIRTTMIMSPPDVNADEKLLLDNMRLVDMVEGPNEVDLFPKSAEYLGKGFPDGPRQFEADLRAAMRKNPFTGQLHLIAPSIGHPGSNLALGPMTDFDYLVMHSYAGGQMPSLSLDGDIHNNIQGAYDLLGPKSRLKPIVATESGYHTALGSDVVLGGAQPGVSEKAQAKYLLRQFAEYYNAGIVRTFSYEFIDEFPDYKTDEREAKNAEACFGIVKHDLTPKPAYTAIKNLIGLLRERSWSSKGKRWIWDTVGTNAHSPASGLFKRPAALNFTLTGDTKNLRHTLLQKQNGDYYLLLWREVPSFDLTTRTDIANPPTSVMLNFGAQIRGGAVYDPTTPAPDPTQPLPPTQIFGPVSQVEIPVADQVLAVQVSPVVRFPNELKTREDTLVVTTTATTADLSWHPYGGQQPAGYYVSRMGKFLGSTTEPAFHDSGLRPGVGYEYVIRSFNGGGAVGPVVACLADTRDEYPDLTVTLIGMQPEEPKPGDLVRFKATIQNIGTVPTPDGVTIGVSFTIDGKVVSWADAFAGPLAPGATHELVANSGPGGIATWMVTPGRHKLRATVDDVNRIVERNKANNTLEATIGQ